MSCQHLTPDELLATTRSVRKRLDFSKPVDIALVAECIELAMQAPSSSNGQGWQFIVVYDTEKKRRIGEYYKQAYDHYAASPRSPDRQHLDSPDMRVTQERVLNSSAYLAAHIKDVPVLVFPCLPVRLDSPEKAGNVQFQASMYASIIPAAWNFMLAARARGLGSCWTTLHLAYEREIAEILQIPFAEATQIAMIPVAYSLGTKFKPGPRKPLGGVMHLDRWQA
jgi:nitroreductase|tara:strand:- start:1358 stop:2029 length:672 start_codon:yes stop_codon:yes gene_type:complete